MSALDPREAGRFSSAIEPLRRWDGRWTVPKPDDYLPGLYRMHQLKARWVLSAGAALTEADARLLQTIAYQAAPETSLFANVSQSNRVPTVIELGCADPDQPCRLPAGGGGGIREFR